MKHLVALVALVGMAFTAGVDAGAQAQAPRVPQPFPGAAPRPAEQPAAEPRAREVVAPPADAPVYPTAELIDSFDAGQGQRYYLYGSNASFADVVTYYKNLLKNGGREIYKTPGLQQFDLGRYQEDQMAYPPSVVVKDYVSAGSLGYLAINGTTEKRFKTIIQIVPATLR